MNAIQTLVTIVFLIPFIGSAQVHFNDKVEYQIDSLFEIYECQPGAAAAICHNGKVLYQKGFGLANLENEVKVSPQTVFETGSVAMHFIATAILLLENEGKLSLDDPIQKHLVTFPKYAKGAVTIRHCLHHTSGLRDYLDLIKMTGRSQHIDFDNKAGHDLLQQQKELTIVPGSDYRYSHSNYLALALIVEQVSGMSIGAYAKENIFAPLGMNSTFFYEDNEKVIKNRALLYGKEDEEYKLKQNFDFTACGDGRLYSNIADMTLWMNNLYSSKIGGDEQFMEKLYTRGVLNNGTEMSYARGLEYGTVNGREDIGHNGWFGGATAMILITPQANVSIVTMGNNIEQGAIGKAFRINSLLFDDINYVPKVENPDASTAAEVTAPEISKRAMEQFCGLYFSYSIGYDYKIYMKDDALYFHDGEHEDVMLKPVGLNEFVKGDGVNWSKIKFGRDGNKKAMFYQYGQRPPMTLHAFESVKPTSEELTEFVGEYHSNELDVTYHLKIEDQKLQVFLGDTQIGQYNSLMADLFNSDHDGYLKFERGANSEISKFTINDYSLGNLSFLRK